MPRSTESINPSWRVVHAALDHILFDEALGNAWLAQRHAPLCSEATRLAIANGAALPKPPAFRPTPMACAAARKQCERLRWPLGFESTLYASWNELTDSQATLQLLDAAHASLEQGGDDEAPDIPGYPVRHDAREQTWTLQLRRYDTERVVRFGTPGAAPVQ